MSVEITSDGRKAVVKLNGQDVAKGLRGYTLSHDSDDQLGLPVLTLDPLVITGSGQWEGDATVRVDMPDEALTALLAAGWTPPPKDQRSP